MRVLSALIAAAIAFAAAGCGQPKNESAQPVARIGKDVITAADLQKEVGPQLEQMERQMYQAKRQALEGMIQKRLFEAKAKEAGVATPNELINKEILSKFPDPPEAEVQALYDQAKNAGQQLPPFPNVKADIIGYMKTQNPEAQKAMKDYYEKLKTDAKVTVLLPPYLPPKKDVEAKGPSKGPKNAPVTIVEFSDYQCPFCVRAEKTVTELLAAYPGKIRLVYRDYPLPMHPLAPKASEAAHCADAQGKYWEMHDKLFAAEGKLEVDNLKKLAGEVGLDAAKFDKCLDSGETAKLIEEHKKAGEALGVNSTPAFFVNGRLLAGALPLEDFKAVVDAELGKK